MTSAPANHAATPGDPQVAERCTAGVCFGVAGDLRFLSHHDELRMLTRAMVRAGWPLAYSSGFNPKPKLVMPLPRSVGIASSCELALVRLQESRPARELYTALDGQLPADCTLHEVFGAPAGPAPQAVAVTYELVVPSDLLTSDLHANIQTLLESAHWPVRRDFGPDKPARTVDIRPFIQSLRSDGPRLEMRLSVVAQRTARPGEILMALDLDARQLAHLVRRVRICWNNEPRGRDRWPAAERNDIGEEEGDLQEDQGK